MKFLILFLIFLCGCQEKFQFKSPDVEVKSASISDGRIILKGKYLNQIESASAASTNLSGYTVEIESKSSSTLKLKLIHASNAVLNLAFGTVLSFIISDAKAAVTVNLTVDVAPTGSVMAFNLAACPAGWSDYSPAEGRYIAGIDPGDPGQSVGDTDNGISTLSALGTLDLFTNSLGESGTPGVGGGKLGVGPAGPGSATIYVNSETPSLSISMSGTVTPPKVILKYCEKD